MPINHKRYRPKENRYGINEKAHIFVPGIKLFNNDFLHQWLRDGASSEINISLLFHKFPRWFKEVDKGGDIKNVSLSRVFEISKRKNADPLNNRDWKKDPKNYKKEHLEDIVELTKTPPQRYEDLKNRYFSIYSHTFILRTKTRLLIGFAGTDTILENSLSLHPYYGFPVIPGSSLKGLARHYCKEYESLSEETILKVFGHESGREDETQEGEVVFFDAWPERWPPDAKGILELDVMTPHYSEYYSQKRFPSDDQDPIPIIFLAVRKGVEFRFCLSASRICRDDSPVALARCYLEKALKTFGAGAKTGSNYGYFE